MDYIGGYEWYISKHIPVCGSLSKILSNPTITSLNQIPCVNL